MKIIYTSPESLQCAELTPRIFADHSTNGDALSSKETFAGARDRRLLDFKHLRAGNHHTRREKKEDKRIRFETNMPQPRQSQLLLYLSS